jgi:hypothetical protein
MLAAVPGAIFSPQRPQNLAFIASGVAHRGHGNEFGTSPCETSTKERLPQRPQNFAPSANLELQFVQATMPGIMLER